MFQVVKEPRWESLQKLRDAASERARYSDYSVCLSNFNEVEIVKNRRVLRSKSITKCIVCQERGGKLRKGMDVNLGKRMLDVAKALPKKRFFHSIK